MLDKFKSHVSFEKFLNDCYCYEVRKQTYDYSYPEFLEYFKNVDTITRHNLIIGINFTYGWMPTILDFQSDDFDEAVSILNKAKNGNNLNLEELEILKGLFNNSLVGTSKLLHFINPEKFAIWDSRVYRYLTGEESYNHRIGNCKSYLSFLDFCAYLTQKPEYDGAHNFICNKYAFPLTKFRSAELIMYLNGGVKDMQVTS